ncbi:MULTISPECIES: hypothetical protein [unclassified Streptomyces]|uniref:hypothetical protein n=1 Tax=Streptomyces TaxID=1883 RepID=UPI001370EDF3|nr:MULTISPECIES: hypothetical protein [unclassified Streptomyces]MYY84863.1 hypothetical protein [Streptomyces sp. SID335]MYZ18779.1 hypothetical protein [Streptomyces sp. SID337]NEA03649.1 hypothetical protein [Streptomyces sp. SID10116]NEB50348.1 hypothetical protein [Streptomyces sp. SID339]
MPPALSGRVLLAEAWGRSLGQGFSIDGDYTEDGITRRKFLGDSGWGSDRAHIVIPAKCHRLATSKGVNKPGRWNIALGEPSDAPDLTTETSGNTSRVYAYHGAKTHAEVDFEGHGSVWLYDFQGGKEQKLIEHGAKFRGTIVIPGPGLVAVAGGHGGALRWGSLPDWRMTLR